MPHQYANQFSAESVRFSMRDSLMLIEVDNALAQATITTHGASVLSFKPKNQTEDLLWVSPTAVFNGEKAVRGGIPVCWPWFGQAREAGLPAHGFVRNLVWHLDHVADLPSGQTELVLNSQDSEKTRALWPHRFHLQLKIEIGERLALSLTTFNPNDYDIEITEALHTYFKVSDASGLEIQGLEKSLHLDKLRENAPPQRQESSVTLNPPQDSVYLNQIGEVVIRDEGLQRGVRIDSQHAASTVVWNPGSEIVKGFVDIPDDTWPQFACVESGNVLDNAVMVPSGEKHTLTVIYSVV